MTKVTEPTTFEFESPLRLERSITPVMETLSENTTSEITFEVRKDGSGWFEFWNEETEQHAEGMLGFNGNELVDYDGVFALFPQLLDKLEELGYNVDDMR